MAVAELLIRNFGHDDPGAILDLFDLGPGTNDDRALAGAPSVEAQSPQPARRENRRAVSRSAGDCATRLQGSASDLGLVPVVRGDRRRPWRGGTTVSQGLTAARDQEGTRADGRPLVARWPERAQVLWLFL